MGKHHDYYEKIQLKELHWIFLYNAIYNRGQIRLSELQLQIVLKFQDKLNIAEGLCVLKLADKYYLSAFV